jgi:hypothetical protein
MQIIIIFCLDFWLRCGAACGGSSFAVTADNRLAIFVRTLIFAKAARPTMKPVLLLFLVERFCFGIFGI